MKQRELAAPYCVSFNAKPVWERIAIVGESGARKVRIKDFRIVNLIVRPGYIASGSIRLK